MALVLDGTTGITSPSGQFNSASTFGFKNRIINGAMVIDQRNAGASVTITNTAATTYVLDRWYGYGNVGSKFSMQRNAGGVTPPVGFTNYLGVTSLSAYSVGTLDGFVVGQSIEGFNFADMAWGTANASPVTLSFWVRSSLTGTFGGGLRNSGGSRSYPFTYTINAANTWEQKTVTIAGDTSGTWLTDSGIGVNLVFSMGAGSYYSGTAGSWVSANNTTATGATSVVGTSGATFYITGVQLEKGSTATSFDYRPYGTELALCQRYYLLLASGASKAFAMGSYQTSAYIEGVVSFPVTMRSTPALEATSGTDYYGIYANGADKFDTLLSEYLNVNSATVYNTTQVSGTAGYGGWFFTSNANAKVAFTAEL